MWYTETSEDIASRHKIHYCGRYWPTSSGLLFLIREEAEQIVDKHYEAGNKRVDLYNVQVNQIIVVPIST